MKTSVIAFSTLFAAAMAFGTPALAGASGKVSEVQREGRTIVIGGKSISISGSSTKVTIKGKDADRSQIKAGMTCTADVAEGRAAMVACK